MLVVLLFTVLDQQCPSVVWQIIKFGKSAPGAAEMLSNGHWSSCESRHARCAYCVAAMALRAEIAVSVVSCMRVVFNVGHRTV